MYESPILLIIVSVALFCVITLFRNFMPEKRRWWQFVIPAFVFVAAFALDYFVETDREKVKARILEARAAVLSQQPQIIIGMLDADYHGQHGYNREAVAKRSRQYFTRPFAKKIRINYNEITVEGDKAQSILNTTVHFALAIIETKIDFIRHGNTWLVRSVDIEKINNKEPPRW
jgi:hypothetical protein